jgi:LAO/AO transport system kinase
MTDGQDDPDPDVDLGPDTDPNSNSNSDTDPNSNSNSDTDPNSNSNSNSNSDRDRDADGETRPGDHAPSSGPDSIDREATRHESPEGRDDTSHATSRADPNERERDGRVQGRGADDRPGLVDRLLAGDHRALARTITRIENRSPGYRELVAALHPHAGGSTVVGVTGSPGAGKSTLVDKLAEAYRDRGLTVGIVAIDPSSPYTGGSVLGDRIRMASTVGDMEVFVRSMSARGQLGGLASATDEAITALSAFGKDVILVETVGAGQNEVDVVRTADTVVVLVQPGSGDDVQTLKAGILEIGDLFVVNKADQEGADRTVAELEEMVHARVHGTVGRAGGTAGHHGATTGVGDGSARPREAGVGRDAVGDDEGDATGGGAADDETPDSGRWVPPVLETVATTGEGVGDLLDALSAHRSHLDRSGGLARSVRDRHAERIRRVLRDDVATLVESELAAHGGIDALAEAVADGRADPYTLADELLEPVRACLAANDPDAEPGADADPSRVDETRGSGEDDRATGSGTDGTAAADPE